MSHRRDRSRSPGEHRSRSHTPESRHRKHDRSLPEGVEHISESDYFLKSSEFRIWLKDEKDRYFDELSGDKARSYFRKFVKAWNRGKLPKKLYRGVDESSISASSQTGYKWSFASKGGHNEEDEIRKAKEEVSAATKGDAIDLPSGSTVVKRKAVVGPTLPSREDLILARESAEDARLAERNYKRKRERFEDKERIEDLVGPKETGREGLLEKKRMRREDAKSIRDAKDDTLGDFDDNTLMGGGDSFKARIAQRDAARRRFEERRSGAREEKESAIEERREAIRQKDKATMDMFKQLAKERFG